MKSTTTMSNGKRTVTLEAGWYKGWMWENVYGWHYLCRKGETPSMGNYKYLIVLRHEPDTDERRQIEERFKDAVAPDGTKGLEYPDLKEGN